MDTRTLGEVSEKLQEVVSVKITDTDPQVRVKKLISSFDSKLTQLKKVTTSQAQINHDAQLFATICTNVRNDLQSLDDCIKEFIRY